MSRSEEIKNLSAAVDSLTSAFNASLGASNETLKIERIVKTILERLKELTTGEAR